jgi:hypothetical protein
MHTAPTRANFTQRQQRVAQNDPLSFNATALQVFMTLQTADLSKQSGPRFNTVHSEEKHDEERLMNAALGLRALTKSAIPTNTQGEVNLLIGAISFFQSRQPFGKYHFGSSF